MDLLVEFGGGGAGGGDRLMEDEGVGPVVAVVDEAAAGEPADEADAGRGGGGDLCVGLCVAEAEGGFDPAVMAENGDALRQ